MARGINKEIAKDTYELQIYNAFSIKEKRNYISSKAVYKSQGRGFLKPSKWLNDMRKHDIKILSYEFSRAFSNYNNHAKRKGDRQIDLLEFILTANVKSSKLKREQFELYAIVKFFYLIQENLQEYYYS